MRRDFEQDFRARFWTAFERARRGDDVQANTAHARHFEGDIGALRVLIKNLPRRCTGLSLPARILIAERLRDSADEIEHLQD